MKTNPRIIPLNLPAGLERQTPGNPVTTRLESAIGNCFPGLEVDVKNLDRRFFPGLIFEFVQFDDSDPRVMLRGAQLTGVDRTDPAVPSGTEFATILDKLTTLIGQAPVFLAAFQVEGGNRIELEANGLPFDWDIAWRLIRSMPPKQVKIELSTRKGADQIVMQAPRRTYQDELGQLSAAYQPGELSQSLCSPWQHDFRDCGCMYWASNHPDIVLPAHPADPVEAHGSGKGAEQAEELVIWMRWQQEKHVPARTTRESTTPFEMDHYEINDRWKDLAMVVDGHESHVPWSIGKTEQAPPLDPKLLKSELRRLAGVEHALAIEYLYARYTVDFENDRFSAEDRSRADFIAHELLVIASSEMLHLRWVNQLLWELCEDQKFTPALGIADEVPEETRDGASITTKPEMRPLKAAIEHFIGAESASGGVEGQYAKILSLLRQRGDSPDLVGLTERIIADGVTHYSRFREIQGLLSRSGGRILRDLVDIDKNDPPVDIGESAPVGYDDLLRLYGDLIRNLGYAFSTWRAEDRRYIIQARLVMTEMDRLATALALRGYAVPFLKIGRQVLGALET